MYQNAIYICFSWYNQIYLFLWKNVDVSRTQGVFHMIHIFFGPSLGKVQLSQASWATDFREEVVGVLLHDCRYQRSHQNYKTKS